MQFTEVDMVSKRPTNPAVLVKSESPSLLLSRRGFFVGSLALTYFRERKLTIIGAMLFHGPVRDGKGWYQKAVAARRNW